jgi:hypothetical protein
VSSTPPKKFIDGVIDTGIQFITGDNNTGDGVTSSVA